MRLPAYLGRVLLVVAVLLAQHTALAHQYWHAGAAQAASQGDSQPQEELCDLHELLGAVLAFAGSAASAQGLLPASPDLFTAIAASGLQFRLPSPHSRGPPLTS